MAQAFYDYVRGTAEAAPQGYTDNGLRAYRHLVFIGASQFIEAHFPQLRLQLGETGWQELIGAFVRQSAWTSPYYGDLKNEFLDFITRESA